MSLFRCNSVNIFSSIIIAGLVFSLLLFSNITFAQSGPSKSYQLKAGFLLHFPSYVEWPDADKTDIFLCIVGEDPFGHFIDDILAVKSNAQKGKKKIFLKRIPVKHDVSACDMIFITKASASQKFWKMLPKNNPILLVSDYEGFSREGGVISFYEENKRVRIEINIEQARKDGLRISSELLKIARITASIAVKK